MPTLDHGISLLSSTTSTPVVIYGCADRMGEHGYPLKLLENISIYTYKYLNIWRVNRPGNPLKMFDQVLEIQSAWLE